MAGTERRPSLLPVVAAAAAALASAALAAWGAAAGAPWPVAAALAAWSVAAVAAALALTARERRRAAAAAALIEGERRLHQAQKMEAVGRLAGGIAHDVNNYLAAIRAHAELIASGELPPGRAAESAGHVVTTVLKASSLVERLLTFARRQPTEPEPVDLGEVVEASTRLLEGAAGAGLTVETRLAPGLWPVRADLAQVEQVLANLFVNARDATPAGGRIVIETGNRGPSAGPPGSAPPGPAGAAGDWVCLAVTDTGRGIPPELRDRIFEPFFTTKEGTGSSGLGLATVYAAVEEAGGRIELDSAPGAGTTFRVYWPRLREEAVPTRPRPAAGGSQEGAAAGAGERLLVVDDNDELRTAVARILRGRGYRVVEAAGPDEAIAAAARASGESSGEGTGPFDLLVTDVQLPGASGPDLAARLRRERPIKVLYMSGYTDRIALRTAPGRGDAYFVKKPFSADGLARMVRDLLDAGPPPEPVPEPPRGDAGPAA